MEFVFFVWFVDGVVVVVECGILLVEVLWG